MTDNELRKDVVKNEIQGTTWSIESYTIRLEFLNSLSELDDFRQGEKDHCERELLILEQKISFLDLKLNEINAIIDSQEQ
jgi:hypothetical protein